MRNCGSQGPRQRARVGALSRASRSRSRSGLPASRLSQGCVGSTSPSDRRSRAALHPGRWSGLPMRYRNGWSPTQSFFRSFARRRVEGMPCGGLVRRLLLLRLVLSAICGCCSLGFLRGGLSFEQQRYECPWCPHETTEIVRSIPRWTSGHVATTYRKENVAVERGQTAAIQTIKLTSSNRTSRG